MSRILRNLLIVLLLSLCTIYIFKFEKKEFKTKSPETQTVELDVHIPILENIPTIATNIISRHFPDEYIEVPKQEILLEIEEIIVDVGPQINHSWKYISTIVQKGQSIYYFKNNSSSRLLELKLDEHINNWTLISIENDHFILREGETLYKVNKK